MNKKLMITISTIFIMLIAVTFCLFIFTSSASGQTSDSYMIKAYDGKVTVFKADREEPYLQFDVYISTLPEFDQKQLVEGIACDGIEELNRRIEDYIS